MMSILPGTRVCRPMGMRRKMSLSSSLGEEETEEEEEAAKEEGATRSSGLGS